RDAGDTIARLEWEQDQVTTASEGHDDRLAAAAEASQEASQVLQARKSDLATLTEDVARLAARHQSAQRLLQDSRKTLERSEAEALRARDAVAQSREAMEKAGRDFATATENEEAAQHAAEAAE